MKFLQSIGIELVLLLAGIAGGFVSLTSKPKNMTRMQQIGTVISGGLTANYLTPLVAEWWGSSGQALYGLAFALGYSGMKSLELVFKILNTKLNTKQDL
ncbi:hypothetical protein HMPREF9711_03131 [Myroides odoratimimus CCUG 3837]|uniref:hypothetical protein n=1 Tax=Myroides odoratimimus TaxID=76832 RepID=UPI000280ACE2|nr:hypothetical protein [Myroides odoratimimus]EKB02669.1 hypothetical protein HMPREF9711_03131 [Myroides odoratimimus CCUG 3837]